LNLLKTLDAARRRRYVLNVFRILRIALVLAGLAQLAIASSSVFIPRLLGWREETARLRPLTRQVFWTYAGYILSMNAAFGALSLFAPRTLLDGSALGRAVCTFIALYWITRLLLQFFVFDRSVATRPLFRFAEAAYVSAFAYLAVVYSAAAVLS
jgi:hypothetical protein